MPVAKKATKTSGTKKKAPTKKPEKVPPVSEDIPKAHVISHLALDEILPNPKNPRKTFDDAPFAELVASIREKGVLQPIIVRPLVDDTTDRRKYEIVAGERRWRASASAGAVTIPAIIRELSDQEAFDIMVIENLQREDLDPLEEARAFEAYATEGGDIEDLANKIGSDPRYIRRRVRILTLPEEILVAWRDGKLSMAHLEQFMRLSRKEDVLKLYQDMDQDWQQWSASDLRRHIDEESPELSWALFDTSNCENCTMNTSIQGGIFGTDFSTEKVLCLNLKCFKEKQVAFWTEHWPETEPGMSFHTKGFVLRSELNWNDCNILHRHHDQLPQCLDCGCFVSVIDLSGHVSYERLCIGSKDCYRAVTSGRDKSGSGANGKNTRVNNIGPEFQDLFYRDRIPRVASSLSFDDERILRLIAWSLLHASSRCTEEFKKAHDVKGHLYEQNEKLWTALEALSGDDLVHWIRRTALHLTLEDVQFGVGMPRKHAMGKHFGLDLARDWILHKEYLQRKTIPEILGICQDLKLLEGPEVKTFAATKLRLKTEKYDTLRKKDLIRLILESGIDLAGKVPKEILKTK